MPFSLKSHGYLYYRIQKTNYGFAGFGLGPKGKYFFSLLIYYELYLKQQENPITAHLRGHWEAFYCGFLADPVKI